MNIKKMKGIMLREKEQEYLRYSVTEKYLIDRIEKGEKKRRESLTQIQKIMQELENQIEFFKK